MRDPAASDPTDADQFRALFVEHHRAVVAYAARRTSPPGDWDTAQDVAASVFVVAWQRLPDVPADARPWLLITARNVLSGRTRGDARRRQREHRAVTDPALARTPAPDPAGLVPDALVVSQALGSLSEQDRELAMLIAWDDLTLTDAATVLGIRADAARTRWKRLRARLAPLLADTQSAPPEAVVSDPAALPPAPCPEAQT